MQNDKSKMEITTNAWRKFCSWRLWPWWRFTASRENWNFEQEKTEKTEKEKRKPLFPLRLLLGRPRSPKGPRCAGPVTPLHLLIIMDLRLGDPLHCRYMPLHLVTFSYAEAFFCER
jgi:hypothetical protein